MSCTARGVGRSVDEASKDRGRGQLRPSHLCRFVLSRHAVGAVRPAEQSHVSRSVRRPCWSGTGPDRADGGPAVLGQRHLLPLIRRAGDGPERRLRPAHRDAGAGLRRPGQAEGRQEGRPDHRRRPVERLVGPARRAPGQHRPISTRPDSPSGGSSLTSCSSPWRSPSSSRRTCRCETSSSTASGTATPARAGRTRNGRRGTPCTPGGTGRRACKSRGTPPTTSGRRSRAPRRESAAGRSGAPARPPARHPAPRAGRRRRGRRRLRTRTRACERMSEPVHTLSR